MHQEREIVLETDKRLGNAGRYIVHGQPKGIEQGINHERRVDQHSRRKKYPNMDA